MIQKQKDNREQHRLLRNFNRLFKPKTILEVGSGYGRFAGKWKDALLYVGIDQNQKHLKHHGYPNRILMQAPHFGFYKRFDLVYSCTALMLNKDAKKTILEMGKLSRKYVLFLESRRDLGWAFKHPYEKFLEPEFSLEEKINLRKGKSYLSLWIFKRHS